MELPQAVRRYIDIGREFTPEGIILHMVATTLKTLFTELIGWPMQRVTAP